LRGSSCTGHSVDRCPREGARVLRAAFGKDTDDVLVQRCGMSIAERIAAGLTKVYDRTRSKKAVDAASADPTGSVNDLKGKKYCVLITYMRDGTPMPSPLWFGVGNGKVYAETGANDWKVKRIRNDPNVRVAPC